MKVLYHECTDELGTELPVEFVDGNGKLWVVPFGEPTEFENTFMADKILEHMKYMGIVEVHFTKTRTGLTYEMEDALKRARLLLYEQEKACVNNYIQTQLETRVQRNFPPLPPTGRALSCVIKHKTNLLVYGIRPVGWEPPYEIEGGWDQPTRAGNAPVMTSDMTVNDQVRELRNLVMSQQQLINELMVGRKSTPGGAGGGSKPAKTKLTPAEALAADAAPSSGPDIKIREGSEDTVESINL